MNNIAINWNELNQRQDISPLRAFRFPYCKHVTGSLFEVGSSTFVSVQQPFGNKGYDPQSSDSIVTAFWWSSTVDSVRRCAFHEFDRSLTFGIPPIELLGDLDRFRIDNVEIAMSKYGTPKEIIEYTDLYRTAIAGKIISADRMSAFFAFKAGEWTPVYAIRVVPRNLILGQ